MVKILNAVLCMGCIAGIVAIIATHNRAAATDDMGANAYFGGGSGWSAVSPATKTGTPGNPFIIGSRDGSTAGTLTPGERARGLNRWNELRELASQPPAPVVKNRKNSYRANKALRAKEAKRLADRQTRRRGNRNGRRARSHFEDSRFYRANEGSYRNSNGKPRRRVLAADRQARRLNSQFRYR